MPVRQVTVHTSQPLAIRPVDISYVDEAHKAFKRFCDNLRCPLCDAQLDGNVHHKKAELYCVTNNDEYRCRWFPGDNEPEMECIKFWYYPWEYVIGIKRFGPGNYRMTVDKYQMDVNQIHRNSTRVELFNYKGPRILALRQRMDEEQFLKKLKTIKVFS